MKKFSILASLLLGFVTGSVQAGQEVYKQVAPPPPPPLYGTGFYGAIDAGANVYQDLGSHTFDDQNIDLFGVRDLIDLDVKLDPNNEVGFFGGIKLGYVFGTGVVRPTLEGDFFYNGFRAGFDVTANGTVNVLGGIPFGPIHGNLNSWVNSGAFMGNFILRFAPGNQRFQPYVGAGVGAYYAQSQGVNVTVEGSRLGTFTPRQLRESDEVGTDAFADLAWQVIAGADYYWTPKFSTFIEYHFIQYTSSTLVVVRDEVTRQRIEQFKTDHDVNLSLGQHLVGVGVRFHF
jgi:opacity protein-like surface antigen